jgi:hypothetical protein
MRKLFKILAWMFGILLMLLLLFILWFNVAVKVVEPVITDSNITTKFTRKQIAENVVVCDDNWLRKNDDGLYELFVSGEPFELGYKNGLLTKELVQYQEQVFVDQLYEMIPSERYLKFLRYFVALFNKDMDKYVPQPYLQEIYGVSRSASQEFDFIAPAYHRILNYHGAHDIGHALQNLNLVACTAFGAWGNRTADSSMIIGRNFDFYMGDDFARDKIIAFYAPAEGHKFAMVTWGGMTGVVSGMNTAGLTITLNSAKSSIPLTAKMPVSLLARHILQHAATIEEAYNIAQQYETFVSESFLIGSASDGKVVVIEKSTEKTAIYDPGKNEIVLTNHFQSAEFKNDPLAIESKEEGASDYRYQRVEELMGQVPRLVLHDFARILRDRKGLGGTAIGEGNEKAINQLIAHHSVIFKPQQRQIWISVNPFQLGKYLAYDLNKIFNTPIDPTKPVAEEHLTIAPDSFLYSNEYKQFAEYRQKSMRIGKQLRQESVAELTDLEIEDFVKLNPELFHSYLLAGKYYFYKNDFRKAIEHFNTGLTKEIPRKVDRQELQHWNEKAQNGLNN